MKKTLLVSTLFILFALSSYSQSWEKLFSGLSEDYFRCVIEVPAGGYIAAGYTSNYTSNDTDAFVVRLNTSGDTIWTYKYNGTLSKKDLFYKVINTSDGGFALCGYTTSITGLSDDAMYMKLNSSGQLQWVKFWGGSGKDRTQDIVQTADDGYTIVGYSTSAPAQYYDAFILRTNSTGDIIWTKLFGTSNYDDANTVQILDDGGFILGGQSNNGINGLDLFLVRTNPSGVAIWTKRFGTIGTDNIDCLILTSDGFVMAGSTNTPGTGDNGYIVKTDTAGNLIWTKSFGNSKPNDFHRIVETNDGGFFATGTYSSALTYDSLPNIWLMKTNANGDSLWQKTYGGESHDHGYSGQQTTDGGYIIAGHTGSFRNNAEAYVLKTNGSGNISNHVVYTTISNVISPNGSSCGSPTTQIKVRILNLSNQSIPNIPVTVIISGAISDTLNQTFSASDTVGTFNTTINTSAGGTYTFYCYTSNGNDVYPARNSITRTFTIGVTPAAPVTDGDHRCGPGTVTLGATAASTIYWYTSSSGGASIFNGTSYTTPSLSSTTTYYTQTGTSCPSARIPVVATINPVSADPFVTGDDRCGNGTLTLTATASDPITWFDVPSGGSAVGTGTSYTTPVLSSSGNYYAQASNGLCPSNRVLVTAEVNTAAADPGTISENRCGPGDVTLSALSPHNVVWFDSPNGGSQVGTGLSFITPHLSVTTTYYAQADNGCLSNRIATIATINTVPADPFTTSANSCAPGSVMLEANSASQVLWFDAASGGNQVGFGSTFTSPSISVTTTYYAQANNGTCSSNMVAATANILSPPAISLGNDTMVMGLSYILDAGPGFPFYSWSTTATTQTITITSPGTYCVTVTDPNGCSNSDCLFVDLITGIDDSPVNKLFAVYPNPTSGKISITFPVAMNNVEIEILNLTGKAIQRIDASNTFNIDLDLSAYSAGMYYLRINSVNKSEVQKIIIQ